VSLKAELNGTRHNTKQTHNTEPTSECEKLTTPKSGEVQEAYAETGKCKDRRQERSREAVSTMGGLRRRAGSERVDVRVGPRSTQHNERLTPKSGEVQEAYAEERGSAGS
jgi:hypothetical protein